MGGASTVKNARGPGSLVLRILLVTGIVEGIVLFILHPFDLPEGIAKYLLNAALLAALSAPLLYLFVIRNAARRTSERERPDGRLLSLVNTVPGAVYRGLRDWSISFIGAEVTKLTGYAPEQFAGGAILWKDLIHPDDLERVRETFRKAVGENTDVLEVCYRIRRKDGGIRWISDRRQMHYEGHGALAYVDGLLVDVTAREEAERRLREAEYRFRTIADTAPSGIVTGDARGRIAFFNRAAERLFGYAADEVVGRNITLLLPDRYRSAHEAGLERFLRTGETRIIGRTVELVGRRKDETEFPIELSLGTWEEAGAPFFSAVIRDITERKEWERTLKESEEQLRAIFEGSKDGILLADVETRKFLTGNRAICDMLQYSLDEFRRLGVEDIHPEEDLPRILDAFERHEEQPEPARDIPVKRKDGSVLFADIKPSPVTISGKRYLIGNFRDVTERRKAEEAFIRLTMAVEQAAEAIVITDTNGNIEYANPAFERITGYSREASVGRNIRILKSGKHDERFYRKMWETLSRGDVWTGRFHNRKNDGTLYEEEAVISPVRNASGKIINFVAGKRDITRELLLQKQVQTAQRMESVGTLAGGIAHDIGNALTGILGYSEMARRRVADRPDAAADLDMIGRCVEQAATLTRQLLTFARRQVIEPVNLDINVVVTDMLNILGKALGENIEIRTFLSKDVPTARLDRGQIEQVVMNLCLNARDAMPSGGRLHVETADVTLDEEYRALHPYVKPGRYALLVVSDTGIGMDDGTLERVFEPFFTTKPVDKGTGLGLSVVYGIVKQHNGHIHVYSEPGKGTTFKVYFPAVETLPDAVPAARREEAVVGGTERILLAEDEESIRMLSERVLKELGYRVFVARNGEEAIEIFHRNTDIDLAVLDVVMPRKGGKEAFEEMRRINPMLKVIFMSGYSADAIHASYVLAPGVPFLPKPYGPNSLARRVREVLDTPG